MKKVVCLLLCVVMVLGFAACDNTAKPEIVVEDTPAPVVTPEPTPEPEVVPIDFVFEREGNPTTGYDWNVTVENNEILKVDVARDEIKPEAGVTLVKGDEAPVVDAAPAEAPEAPDGAEMPADSAEVPDAETPMADDDDVVETEANEEEEHVEIAEDANVTEPVGMIAGAPSMYKFTFHPLKEGSTMVRLDYKRSWEDTEYDIHEAYKATVAVRDYKMEITMEPVEEKIEEIAKYSLYKVIMDEVEVTLEEMYVAGIDVEASYIMLDKYSGKGMLNIQYADGVNALECKLDPETHTLVAEDTSKITYSEDGNLLTFPASDGGFLVFAPEETVKAELQEIQEKMRHATYYCISMKERKKDTVTLDNMEAKGIDLNQFYMRFNDDGTGTIVVSDNPRDFTWKENKVIFDEKLDVAFKVDDDKISIKYDSTDYVFKLSGDTIYDIANLINVG